MAEHDPISPARELQVITVTRRCRPCGRELPVTGEFFYRVKGGDTFHTVCKRCWRSQTKSGAQYRKALKAKGDLRYKNAKGRLNGNRFGKSSEGEAINARRAWLSEYKLKSGCADCGYRSHSSALEFDHLPGFQKVFNLSQMRTKFTQEEVEAEVKKCEVVCANCHRVRTVQRRRERIAAKIPARHGQPKS